MENSKLQAVLMQELPLKAVHVISNDGSHFQVIAIGEIFNALSRVKKHQVVYAPLIKYIANNTIHSVSIKTYTPEEWAEHNKLNS